MATKREQYIATKFILNGRKGVAHKHTIRLYFQEQGIEIPRGKHIKTFAFEMLTKQGLLKDYIFPESNTYKNEVVSFSNKHESSPKPKYTKKYKAIRARKSTLGFYDSDEWQILRRAALKKYGCKCMKCGTTKEEMHVDHIKPRSKYPEFELDFSNLQVLCKTCNMKKLNIDETDYRTNSYLPKHLHL